MECVRESAALMSRLAGLCNSLDVYTLVKAVTALRSVTALHNLAELLGTQ